VLRARVLLVAAHAALLVVGVLLAVVGTMLIPLQWPGRLGGLAVLIAVVGNFAAGLLGALGLRVPLAGAVPGMGWIIAVLVLGWPRREGDVLVPQSVPGFSAVGTIGVLFLMLGAVAAVAGVAVGARHSRPRAG
jgi:hypothetical protein